MNLASSMPPHPLPGQHGATPEHRRPNVPRGLTRGRQQAQQGIPASEIDEVSLGSPEQWAGAVGRGPRIADATHQVRSRTYDLAPGEVDWSGQS